MISPPFHHIAYILLSSSRLGGGGGGGLPIFVLVKKGGCQKILYDLVGLILKHFALLKNILYPPPHPPAIYIINETLCDVFVIQVEWKTFFC